MSPTAPPTPPGADTRSLAPDLARGVMLLAIAVAHAPVFLADWDHGPAAPNAVAEFVKHLVADNQARAMFVFLFGYGLGQLVQRQYARGADWASSRRLLRRRGFWLLVIGFAHAALLVPLDIIAVYGLTLLMLAPMVRARDSVLLWTAAVVFVPSVLLTASQSVLTHMATAGEHPVTLAATMAATPWAHVADNVLWWPLETPVATLVVIPGVLVGVWAARRRILDEPERHTATLRRVAVVAIGASVAGRLPAALVLTGVGAGAGDSAALVWAVVTAHTVTGYAGGVGMAAVVGLLAVGIRRRGPLTTALAALGQRSMTFYLFQSVVFVALFYPFTLDLSADLGIAAGYGVAVGIWVVSVALAGWMHAAGRRGPAEVLLRRLSAVRRPEPASP